MLEVEFCTHPLVKRPNDELDRALELKFEMLPHIPEHISESPARSMSNAVPNK